MWHVEVLVAGASYHKDEPLTYSTPVRLAVGRVVGVPLRNKQALGVVTGEVKQPLFTTKQVIAIPDIPALPNPSLQLLNWIRQFYPAPLGIITQLFLPDSLPKQAPSPDEGESAIEHAGLPPLTDEQRGALPKLVSPGLHILHGETGSGKTRVYLELAIQSFQRGTSSLILTPEIGLTSQLAEAFKAVFGGRVLILHSGLTASVRRQSWRRILETKQPLVVIGARSALFAPLQHLGLIVVDESHETSYKQDQAPYYHASAVAAKLASLHQATLVLGSATPLVNDYYIASAKERPIIQMTQLAVNQNAEVTPPQIVDLKDRSQFSKSPYLSNSLIAGIRERLTQNEQTLLFLNRRGTARVIFCEHCGWQLVCPHCDLPLIYHGDHHVVRCHSCSYRAAVPASCPECQSSEIVFKSVGTKAIEAEAKRLFPEARIMRFDTDNKKSERLDVHYQAIRAGEVDIIVGTQTLAKGLDLPKLGLVGVIIADTSLYFPDFSAQERTYQLLSQVVGRVGRGHRQGSAIIQTYSPGSALLQAVLTKNWDLFYNSELAERRLFSFPPFWYLLKISCKRAASSSAQKAAETFAAKLRSQEHNIIVEGPSPAFHEKVQNKFVWQLIVKAKRREHLLSVIKHLPSGWSYDIDPMNLL